MTKCLWVDPVYESLDDISKMMLPYIPSKAAQDLVNSCSTIEMTGQEMLDKFFSDDKPYRWMSLNEVFRQKFKKELLAVVSVDLRDQDYNKTPVSEVTITFDNPPDELEIDVVNATISVDKIVAKVELEDVESNIKHKKSRLFEMKSHKKFRFVRGSNQSSPRNQLKHILSIFTSEKTRFIDPNKIAALIEIESRRWFKTLDIRSSDFVWRFEEEVIRAIGGDQRSVSWLKVLKARSLDKEPIYSMELR